MTLRIVLKHFVCNSTIKVAYVYIEIAAFSALYCISYMGNPRSTHGIFLQGHVPQQEAVMAVLQTKDNTHIVHLGEIIWLALFVMNCRLHWVCRVM